MGNPPLPDLEEQLGEDDHARALWLSSRRAPIHPVPTLRQLQTLSRTGRGKEGPRRYGLFTANGKDHEASLLPGGPDPPQIVAPAAGVVAVLVFLTCLGVRETAGK